MYALGPGLLLWLFVTLAALSLLATGGLVYWGLSTGARLRRVERDLAVTRHELEERSAALAQAESEMERIKSIPKAELLPMLKLAHEQRSPLAAIQNALDMLLQGYAASDPALQDEMLGLARERAATMLERVNDFLRLGSVRHAEIDKKVQAVQLLEVVERLIPEKRVRARWKAVDFLTDVPDSLPVVMATYEDMEHLLSNLINNAIKYTDPGGKVTVSLREENGSVVGAVMDTGVGISPRDLPKIFDEFYRADGAKDMAVGTGLGLAIVKRVVDLYGGHLDVRSEVGKGSQFTFTFPKGVVVHEEETTKTFHALEASVVSDGLCGKCGGCTTFCSAGRLNALQVGWDGVPCYADETKCLRCGICYLICPLTNDLDAEVRRRYKWRLPIGAYQSITSARATDEALMEVAGGHGVVNALLLYMLENYVIQGALVTQETTPFSCQPMLATTREGIVGYGGAQVRSQNLDLPETYETYAPILSSVKDLGDTQLKCLAMEGTPCQIRTVRKAQCLGVFPSHIIGYTIGRFCMERFSFDNMGRRALEEKLQVGLSKVQALGVEEELCVSLADGTVLRMPYEDLETLARPACLVCTEFASDYADIAVGGLGSPSGYATVLIRTEKGERVYSGALSQGYIEERAFREATEQSSERTRMLASVVAMARRKRERGEARLRELGVESALHETRL
jgi:coenzyme F420 hydrogenase subunit beta